MAEKPSKLRSFFSLRTSYFNTNIQSAAEDENNSPFYGLGDSVDNTTKRRRKRNNNNNNNNQQQDNTNDNNEKSNSNTTVVEVTTEVQQQEQEQDQTQQDTDQIENTDAISDLLGHFGWWQFIWTVTLSLFQFPSTFHLFSFVFEVSGQNECTVRSIK